MALDNLLKLLEPQFLCLCNRVLIIFALGLSQGYNIVTMFLTNNGHGKHFVKNYSNQWMSSCCVSRQLCFVQLLRLRKVIFRLFSGL